jgi:hypothetical protein
MLADSWGLIWVKRVPWLCLVRPASSSSPFSRWRASSLASDFGSRRVGALSCWSAPTAELALYVGGSGDIRMSAVGFAMRIVLLVAVLVIFALAFRFSRAQAAD